MLILTLGVVVLKINTRLVFKGREKPSYTVEAGGVGVSEGAGGFHISPSIEPITPRMKPMKPKMLKNPPIMVKTRIRIALVLILDLFSLFILTDPTIMTIPQTKQIPPTETDMTIMSSPETK